MIATIMKEQKEEEEELEYPLLIHTKINQGGYYNHPKLLLDHLFPALRKHIPSSHIAFNRVIKFFEF